MAELSMAFSRRPHSGIEPPFAAECRCSAQARPGLDRRRFAPSHDLRRCKSSKSLSLSHLRLKNCANSGPFLSQDRIDHSVKYTPRPRYSSAAKSALLGGSEFCHGSARTRIQRIHPELYAIGAACKCMAQQQVLRSRIHDAPTNFRCVVGATNIDAAKLFFGSNIAREATVPK
jgi:hypothetical protein